MSGHGVRQGCFLALALALGACAVSGAGRSPRAPRPVARVMNVGDVGDVEAGDDVAPVAPLPPVEDFEPHDSRTLVGGLGCLIRLQELDIAHQHLPALRGVNTPVRVTGPVGGIVYRPLGRQPLNADCRLVLALHRAAPYLLTLGVTEVQFSGAYSYRRMPGGRLSRHALGLAIDVHRVVADGELLDVSEDYALNLREDGCRVEAPTLNRMACLLLDWGVFDRVLTPDFDRAHDNHLHLAILALRRGRLRPRGPATP